MTADSTRTETTTRREFLKTSAAAALAAGAFASVSQAGTQNAPFLRMRLSLAAYSLRSLMQQNWPAPRPRKTPAEMNIESFVDYCAALDLDGCELTSYYFPEKVTDGFLARLKVKALWNRLAVSGTAIGNDFCVKEGEARDKQLTLCRQWVDYAAVMGAPAIRIFAGRVPKGDTEEAAIQRAVAGIDESLDYAEQKGVTLALENHGGITATPAMMMRIVKGVRPSAFFGVNFDSGNFRTDDPYRDLEVIAPYTVNAQIKVAVTRNGKKEPADLPRVMGILKDAGYRGWVVLEYEEKEDPKEAIPRYLDELRKLM